MNRAGALYGLLAYGWWGLMPLYIRQLAPMDPAEILAQRIVWSLVVMMIVVTLLGRWGDLVLCLGNPNRLRMLTLTSLLIASNWFVYILSVDLGRVKEASLGYFITPLFNVLLGLTFFRERLRKLQWVALVLAFAGVAVQASLVDQFPWIALALAGTFSLYGMIRKKLPIDGVLGLSAETCCLAPFAAAFLGYLSWNGTLMFGSSWSRPEVLIPFSGIATAVPLVCFGQAARLLPLSTLGFFQYIGPTLQFGIAVGIFREEFRPEEWFSFVLIWVALGVFTVDSIRTLMKKPDVR